jgi:large subunit ribosomal protein L18
MITDRSNEKRMRRKVTIKKRIRGGDERPRLTIFRSAKHTYAQVINDHTGSSLASASTMEKQHREAMAKIKKIQAAVKIGELIAERCLAKKIDKVVFDRNGYPYHGRVAKLAEAARAKGLKF